MIIDRIRSRIQANIKDRIELEKIHDEYHRKVHDLYRGRGEFHAYHRHVRFTRPISIIFVIILWYLIFRYVGLGIVSATFAVISVLQGVAELLFLNGLEKKILKPIEGLRTGVEEVLKGNYEVTIPRDGTVEISVLIDSFNAMTQKLLDIDKTKREYEENRKTLVANISHDLKTPITTIQGYIETIQERDDLSRESLENYYQIIYGNATYLNRLIDDLFLFSKLDMQKLELNIEAINVKAFLQDLMDEYKYELEDKGVRFYYKIGIAPDTSANIDRKRINQVFRNIIGNAVKYGDSNNLIISVAAFESVDEISIDIADNGPGISSDQLPFIFDRFYRTDSARTKDLISTGLGLAIAKELVEAHGGRVNVTSTLGEGTKFTLVFPNKPKITGEMD